MNTDLVKIDNFKKFLNEVQIRAKESATVTSAKMEKMLELDATPFDRAMYENFFDSASETDSNETTFISKLRETKEKIDGVIDTINSNLAQRDKIKQIINNQQLRPGITGIAKDNISKNQSPDVIFKFPYFVQEIVSRPHVDTPHKKGGNLTRRNRKRKIKSKKCRSLHK
jgi:hypothetical protein